MKILYVGAGFVGACSAAVMADAGHDVLLYDIDEEKIKKLGSNDIGLIESCLFEDGLGDILIKNKNNITFTTNYSEVAKCLDLVDAVFMCLPTPEKDGVAGQSDLTYYHIAAEKLAQNLEKRNNGLQSKYVVVVNKSTVPIAMVDETRGLMEKYGVKNFGVVSNPEFLIEGKAIFGSVHPDRVVVGAEKEEDFKVMRQIYARFLNSSSVKYIEVTPEEAAAGKLLANYLLFNRLAVTFDVVGRVCENFDNVNFENLRKILTSDGRIGNWGFYDSVYAGGSCFIKDAASLAYQLEEIGVGSGLVRQVLNSNNFQRDNFFSRAEKEAGFVWKDKKVAILGVAFKQNTNDVRNSSAINVVKSLIEKGVKEIKIYDPVAMPMFKALFDSSENLDYKIIDYFNSEKEALINTDTCLILTDWPKFMALGEVIKSVCPAPYLIMDGRRMLSVDFKELQNLGYDIISVGSLFLKGKK
jgi:UDPglucose 6-dehydrogenase